MVNLNASGIYKITNTVNGKVYFGSAKNFKNRWQIHRTQFNSNTHHDKHLQRAWDKYGKDAFLFEVVMYCAEKHLLFYEQRFLDAYWDGGKECYNICKVAGSSLGIKRSEETRKKLSDSHIGNSNALGHSGSSWYLPTDETKNKISKALIGRCITDESRDKMSKSHKGIQAGSNNPMAKLTEKDIIEIRADGLLGLTQTEIAVIHNMVPNYVGKILRNEIWKEVA